MFVIKKDHFNGAKSLTEFSRKFAKTGLEPLCPEPSTRQEACNILQRDRGTCEVSLYVVNCCTTVCKLYLKPRKSLKVIGNGAI